MKLEIHQLEIVRNLYSLSALGTVGRDAAIIQDFLAMGFAILYLLESK